MKFEYEDNYFIGINNQIESIFSYSFITNSCVFICFEKLEFLTPGYENLITAILNYVQMLLSKIYNISNKENKIIKKQESNSFLPQISKNFNKNKNTNKKNIWIKKRPNHFLNNINFKIPKQYNISKKRLNKQIYLNFINEKKNEMKNILLKFNENSINELKNLSFNFQIKLIYDIFNIFYKFYNYNTKEKNITIEWIKVLNFRLFFNKNHLENPNFVLSKMLFNKLEKINKDNVKKISEVFYYFYLYLIKMFKMILYKEKYINLG